jgi:excisionase family DNA binding protein
MPRRPPQPSIDAETPPGGPSDPSLPSLLTIEDVAEILKLSTRSVRRLIDRGELAAVHIGRSVRIHPKALRALIED